MDPSQFRKQQEQDVQKRDAERKRQIAAEEAARKQRVQREIAAEEQRRKQRDRDREAARLAIVQEAEATLKAEIRLRFLTTPGSTPEQFEQQWPSILADIQREQTLRGTTLKDEYRARARTLAAPEQ